MENLIYYNKLKKPPLDALKQITAGRLKGKSDISPQWRIEAMTELFGPCGIGWYYTIDRKWSEAGSDGQLFAFVDVSVYYKHEGEWSKAIPGTGGSMLVTNESKGLYSSDEGYKMATTDALSVAFKALGMAADIYRGLFDGSKYTNQNANAQTSKPAENQPKTNLPKFTVISSNYDTWVDWFAKDKRTNEDKLKFMREKMVVAYDVEEQFLKDVQTFKVNNNLQ